MPELDVAAVRRSISRALGDDEVWELVRTFRAHGGGGEVRVEMWHHPEYGYTVSGRDEAGRETHSNPETDAVVAVDIAHLHGVRVPSESSWRQPANPLTTC